MLLNFVDEFSKKQVKCMKYAFYLGLKVNRTLHYYVLRLVTE